MPDANDFVLPLSRSHRALRRLLGTVAAAVLAPPIAGAVSGALRIPDDRVGGAVREAALFAPLALPLIVVLAPLALVLSPERVTSTREWVGGNDGRVRSFASLALVTPPAAVVWVALAAGLGRRFMTEFHHVGLAALAQAVALLLLGLFVLAVAQAMRRLVEAALPARMAGRRVVLPAGLLGGLLALGAVLVGLRSGDLQGRGGLFGAFGVLRKPELDLAPVWGLGGTIVLALVLAGILARRVRVALVALVAGLGLGAVLLDHSARHFADAPSAATIEARPGLARTLLRAIRRRTDHDRDGASPLFGGGDCNDADPARGPSAHDVPGNGIDEDCSGRDAPRPLPRPAATGSTPQAALGAVPPALNLVLITVDTLRADLHYAGNPREMSPEIDRLAAQSVVFEHAYALSSYTGRAVAPMLAGRYPTECARDAEHFTAYLPANVLLAERLKTQGFRTMGAASHFYFERHFGLAQGMDTWDLSARPSGDAQETSSADARVADRAIALLRAPENASGRFFLWVHFFDPHKQYVAHPELPSFGTGERARYDGEVAWTDRQVGRLLTALGALPFANRTAVVLTADHGEAFGEHGMGYHGVELWEELVRVPWMLRVPGVAPRRIAAPRSQIDLVPTLLELLRVPAPNADAPDALSGASLVPELLGSRASERPIYIELPEGPFNSMRRSVIADGWKLTERGARRFELYHLAEDPGERSNVAPSQPEALARMRGVLEQVRSGLREVRESGGSRHE